MLTSATQLTRTAFHSSHGAASALAYSHAKSLLNSKPDHLLDTPYFARWLKKLTSILNVELAVSGAELQRQGLFVSNHISWVDALVLLQLKHFSFIAKTEVRKWPMIGAFSELMKTSYIDRRNKFSVYRSLPEIEHHLQQHRSVIFFPEGTTTCGTQVLDFYPMLFETAVRQNQSVQAITLRYCNEHGEHLPCVGFVDDDILFDTLFRMQKQPRIIAQMHISPPISSKEHNRKQLAQITQQQMSKALAALSLPQ